MFKTSITDIEPERKELTLTARTDKECCKWMLKYVNEYWIAKIWSEQQNMYLYHINGRMAKIMKYCPFCGQELFFGKDPLE